VRAAPSYEAVGLRKDGSTFIAEVRGTTLSSDGGKSRVTAIRDITDRKRVEAEQQALTERMQQAQKLESLGVLAGGVAHDFNNILTVILNGVELAKQDAIAGTGPVAHLDAVSLAAQRAADLCRQMLAFAGKARLEREALDLSVLVREISEILEATNRQ
jgi:two-component system cell cycle sensor histidine kinase/response regulator CckA